MEPAAVRAVFFDVDGCCSIRPAAPTVRRDKAIQYWRKTWSSRHRLPCPLRSGVKVSPMLEFFGPSALRKTSPISR
jgi:hypothetical protein